MRLKSHPALVVIGFPFLDAVKVRDQKTVVLDFKEFTFHLQKESENNHRFPHTHTHTRLRIIICDYRVLIIYNLAPLKVRVRIMLFGCSVRSTATTERLSNFPTVTLYLIAIAITTCVHRLASLRVNPSWRIDFQLLGRVQNVNVK